LIVRLIEQAEYGFRDRSIGLVLHQTRIYAVVAGSMRELSGDRRRQVIRSGTNVTSREREVTEVGSVIKKRRKRMAKKKHRKLLKRTRIQRRRAGK
jgi:Mitochondrial mRNA-processing protein COX24, C-terminal